MRLSGLNWIGAVGFTVLVLVAGVVVGQGVALIGAESTEVAALTPLDDYGIRLLARGGDRLSVQDDYFGRHVQSRIHLGLMDDYGTRHAQAEPWLGPMDDFGIRLLHRDE